MAIQKVKSRVDHFSSLENFHSLQAESPSKTTLKSSLHPDIFQDQKYV